MFSTKDLTITGAGTLTILAENGIGLSMGSYGYNLNIKGGAMVYAKGMYGVVGSINTAPVGNGEVTESYVTTLSINNEGTELHAFGSEQSVKTIAFLGDGIEYICEDNESLKLYFKKYSICTYDSKQKDYFPVANQWICLTHPGGITTGLEALPQDNVQCSMFNVQCDSWFTIDGRKLSGKPTKKGIYIQNGNKVVIK